MRVGDIIRLKKIDTFPRPPAPGSTPRYRIDRFKWGANKGNVFVAVILGGENLDGSDAIDTDDLIVRLAREIEKKRAAR
jgi:hypothetical protein